MTMTMKEQIEQMRAKLPSLVIVRAVPSMRGPGIMDVSLMAAESEADGGKPVASTGEVRRVIQDAGLLADSVCIFPGAAGQGTDAFVVRGLRPDPDAKQAAAEPPPQRKAKG